MISFRNIKNALMNLEKLKKELIENEFSTLHEKQQQHQHLKLVKMYLSLFQFPHSFPLEYALMYKVLRNQTENNYLS